MWCGAASSVKEEPLRGATVGRRSAEQQEEHPSARRGVLLDKTSVSTDGDVVEYSHVVLAGERTELQYSVPLERWTQ